MAWLLAMRPRTLPAAATPVLVGSALAYAAGAFRAGPALAALIGALLLQIGSNFANDVFDFDKGADGPDRLGPTRAVAAGLITPRAMRLAMALTFVLATLVGIYLVGVAGWPIVAIGLCSIAAAVAYTGGPYPLGYHGLGEVFVFLFFGLVAIGGTYFVQVGRIDTRALAHAIPIGVLASAIIVVNNLRDRVSDARVGKRTLAVRLGREGTLTEYRVFLIVAYAMPLVWWMMDGNTRALWMCLPWLSAPLAIATERRLRHTDGAALNPLLGETARLLAIYGLLSALGVVLAARG
jgi:1,4-dihydroxy-2-naphthoate octaprenyltransferase